MLHYHLVRTAAQLCTSASQCCAVSPPCPPGREAVGAAPRAAPVSGRAAVVDNTLHLKVRDSVEVILNVPVTQDWGKNGTRYLNGKRHFTPLVVLQTVESTGAGGGAGVGGAGGGGGGGVGGGAAVRRKHMSTLHRITEFCLCKEKRKTQPA